MASYEYEPEVLTGQSWSERQIALDDAWESTREQLLDEYLEHSAFFKTACQRCRMQCHKGHVRCMSCREVLCHNCDLIVHRKSPFHNRWLTSDYDWKPLLAMEFVNEQGVIGIQGIKTLRFHFIIRFY
jgi:hypothetical protein